MQRRDPEFEERIDAIGKSMLERVLTGQAGLEIKPLPGVANVMLGFTVRLTPPDTTD